jgi:hypothetical protein
MVVTIHQKLCGITSHLINADKHIPITISVDVLETVNRVTVQSCLHEKYTCTFETKIKMPF